VPRADRVRGEAAELGEPRGDDEWQRRACDPQPARSDQGSATAATPTTRGAISAQTSGRDVLRRPVA
jgi:hypothetical protein